MRDDELVNLVDQVLYLVEVGSGSPAADESELGHLLDRLALALRHTVDPGEPASIPEIPPRELGVLRKVAASRFPGFGPYNRPHTLTREIGSTAVEVASAPDDVAAIADHLHVVAWLWRSRDWETGLWYLHASHRAHWGEAMRSLQLYLHVRARERAEDEYEDGGERRGTPS